jgi:transposase
MAMLADTVDVVIGVDTHKHTHTAAVVTVTGAVLAERTAPTTPDGYERLLAFADTQCGPTTRRVWAIESTGGYGAGFTRMLAHHGEQVVELDRPKRAARRHGAKSDPLDAVRAAREVLARAHLAQPRASGRRAALAVRLAARRSAVEASSDAQRQLHAHITAAPERLRSRLRDQTIPQLLVRCARLRTHRSWDPETAATAITLRVLAGRIRALDAEAAAHKRAIRAIVRAWRPDLLTQPGVGPIVAATLLCAWSHAGRCRSEAAFAMLAGTAPIPASSGQTIRYRLNRSGDRRLNRALHTVVLVRLTHDAATRAYAQRRREQGKTNREIRRCLARYITRQLYRLLETV